MNESILDRVIWLVFSAGLAILSAVTLAYVDQLAQRAPMDKKWWYGLLNPWLIHTLRFFYAICIPAVALFAQGTLTYRGLGFKPFPWTPAVTGSHDSWLLWLKDFEILVLILVASGLILAYGLKSSGGDRSGQRPGIVTNLTVAGRESLIDQFHWAFYRELCVTIWGFNLGSWIVMVPLSIELLLNPATWTRVRNIQGCTSLITHCGILFASTILFIQTQNLWLMFILEFALRMLFTGILTPSERFQHPDHDNTVRVNTIGIT